MDETIINRVRALRACGASLLEIARTMADVDPALVWLAWFGATIVDREPDQAPASHVGFCYRCGTVKAPHAAERPYECLICAADDAATCALCGDAAPCSSPKCAALDRTGYGWRANSATVKA